MKNWMRLTAGVAGGLMIWSGAALGQDKPADCSKAGRPDNIEGQVIKVDMGQERITMRAANGDSARVSGREGNSPGLQGRG